MEKIVFLVGGAVICTLIDNVIGVRFEKVNPLVQFLHKFTYMGWGAAIMVL